jgi:predicted metal-dependent hydrolase
MIESAGTPGGFILCHDGERIPFVVGFRRRKSLAIVVHPDLRVEVTAPADSPLDKVLPRVERRAAWIVRQRRFFERYQPTLPARRYLSGETHLYLGRQYRLRVRQGTPEGVKLAGKFFEVRVRAPNDVQRIERLLDEWYREHARLVFDRRLALSLAATASIDLADTPRLMLRRMVRRWGSCTRAGNILLNVDLVKVSVSCIDYVLTHELCHLKVHSHSKEFYRLLDRCMPDWKARRERLNRYVI